MSIPKQVKDRVMNDTATMEDMLRVSYELFIGELPKGHRIHQKCGEPLCFNPTHLQALPEPQLQ